MLASARRSLTGRQTREKCVNACSVLTALGEENAERQEYAASRADSLRTYAIDLFPPIDHRHHDVQIQDDLSTGRPTNSRRYSVRQCHYRPG